MNNNQPAQPEKPARRVRRTHPAQIIAPILGVLSVVLAVLLAILYLRNILLRKEMTLLEEKTAAELASAQTKLEYTIESTIPVEEFKNNAAAFNVSAEFIQRFFDDVIVYKDQGIVYAPIDDTLKKNHYDWRFLDRRNGRMSYEPAQYPAAVPGIDVAKFQQNIDWEKVAGDGIKFAMIRFGYRGYGTGEMVTDPTFVQNIEGALNNGIDAGVYFFSQAVTIDEAIEEADYVLDGIRGYDVRMPIVFDMELVTESSSARANSLTPEERTAVTIAFCERIKDAGYTPMVYGNAGWFLSKVNLKDLERYPVWLAQYYREPFFPYEFQIWQYSNTGKVDGIDGNVDLNLCFKTDW